MVSSPPGRRADLALVGGRVVDPETGTDAILDVSVIGDRIAAVGADVGPASEYLDCTGLVVCPGFIDLHSHAQSMSGSRLQVLDGVTTALDLECGVLDGTTWHARALAEGRAAHFGYAASWAMARAAVRGVPVAPAGLHETPFAAYRAMAAYRDDRWRPGGQERRLVRELLQRELAAGALGVGVMLGYLPDSPADELTELAGLSARIGTPLAVHSRSSAARGPVTALDAVRELVAAADQTGVHAHLCHVNSTSSRFLPQIVDTIEAARSRGLEITTEAYPYERGSTVVGAPFLTVEELAREDRTPSSLTYLATGEAIADAHRLDELRSTDPGGLVLTTTYDVSDPGEARLFDQALTISHSAFASDAMPSTPGPDRRDARRLSDPGIAHPRSAGCFSRVMGTLVRDRGLLTLPEAIRRCTLVPADIVGAAAPAMSRKGRLRPGADADVTVFDPATIADRATYEALRPSTGVLHVLVAGTPVVRDGQLRPEVAPGRPVTRGEEAA